MMSSRFQWFITGGGKPPEVKVKYGLSF